MNRYGMSPDTFKGKTQDKTVCLSDTHSVTTQGNMHYIPVCAQNLPGKKHKKLVTRSCPRRVSK